MHEHDLDEIVGEDSKEEVAANIDASAGNLQFPWDTIREGAKPWHYVSRVGSDVVGSIWHNDAWQIQATCKASC